jgi:hypothetical protein
MNHREPQMNTRPDAGIPTRSATPPQVAADSD